MKQIERIIDEMILEVYETQVYKLKMERNITSRDIQTLINKTVLVDDINELYRILKELGDSDPVGNTNDGFFCWLLFQSVSFMLGIKYDWLKYTKQKLITSQDDVLKLYQKEFELLLLGQVNSELENNVVNVKHYFQMIGGPAFIKRVEKASRRAYFATQYRKKNYSATRILRWQWAFYRHYNRRLQKLTVVRRRELFTKQWDFETLQTFYIDTLLFEIHTNILQVLYSKAKYLSFERGF